YGPTPRSTRRTRAPSTAKGRVATRTIRRSQRPLETPPWPSLGQTSRRDDRDRAPTRGEDLPPFSVMPEQRETTMSFIETPEEAVIQDAPPPRRTAPLKVGRDAKRRHGQGGFSIEILHPGLVRRDGDSGIGTIGRIDDASVAPGTLVPMHPHRDDEIITYLRSGRVMHKDTVGEAEWVT